MGVCKCNKNVLIERHFEENAYDSDNLVLKGNELINQKANKVKSIKIILITKLEYLYEILVIFSQKKNLMIIYLKNINYF